jgi:hypothetical protein
LVRDWRELDADLRGAGYAMDDMTLFGNAPDFREGNDTKTAGKIDTKTRSQKYG